MRLSEITPRRVVAAYKKLGLKPAQVTSGSNGTHCCALGVLAADKDGRAHRTTRTAAQVLRLPLSQALCFALGFDRTLSPATWGTNSHSKAYNLGVACAKSAMRAFKMKPLKF